MSCYPVSPHVRDIYSSDFGRYRNPAPDMATTFTDSDSSDGFQGSADDNDSHDDERSNLISQIVSSPQLEPHDDDSQVESQL